MLRGTITALVTPFREEGASIDFDALEHLVEWQLECGVNGLVVCGTTGESATLSGEEKIALIKRVVEITQGRVPIVAGTGTNDTRASVEMTKAACQVGADAALIVSPYYNKPSQEGLYLHFRTIAKEGGLPIVLYNIPGRTGVEMSTETLCRLAPFPEVIGLKQAVDSAQKIMELAETVCSDLSLFAGDCALTYVMMSCGGKGVISASANAFPQEMCAVTDAASRGDMREALQAQIHVLPMIRAIFRETNPAPAKAALKLRGIIPEDTLRLPMVPVCQETREVLSQVLGLSELRIANG